MTGGAAAARPDARAPRAVTFTAVLRHREYRGLWLAQVTSSVGDQLAKIALAILVFRHSNSALLASLAYAVTLLPALVVGPVSGLLADIRPRREVMVGCDLARAALVGLMCLPGIPILGLIGMLLVVSAVNSPFLAARSALLPDILDGEAYPAAQSLGQVSEQIAQIVGFGAGGAVVGVLSARGALAADAVTFVVSALLLRAFVRRRAAVARRTEHSFWYDSVAGARVVWTSPLLRNLVVLAAVSVGLIIATEGLAVAYAAQLHQGDVATGVLTAAVPVGNAAGFFAVTRWIPAGRRLAAIRTLAVAWPVPLIATVLHPPVAVAAGLWALSGLLVSYHLLANLLFTQALQPAVRGRAFAFARMLLIGSQGIGLLAAGLAGQLLDPARAVALAGSIGLLVCPLLTLGLRAMGRHRAVNRPHPASSHVLEDRNNSMAVPAPGQARWTADVFRALRARPAPVPAAPWRGHVVIGLSLALIGVIGALIFSGWVPNTAAHAPWHITWWELTLGYATTYLFSVPFQRGKDAWIITLGPLPLVMGLLFASPRDLLVSGLIGASALHLRLKLVPVKYLVSRANFCVEILVATGIFALLHAKGANDGWALAAAFIAAVASDLSGAVCGNLLRKLFDPAHALRTMVRPGIFMLVGGMAASSLGLLAVAAMWSSPGYGLLLVLAGVLVIGGSRAYADLQERHKGLNQLYEFQGQLGPLLLEAGALAPVLARTRDILLASSVELAIEMEGLPGKHAFGARRVLTLDAGGNLHEVVRHSPEDTDPTAANQLLTVVLTAGERRLGTLSVRDRLGNVRGFNRSDLQLLETLGTHVSNALERGQLLERLQEAATHDALTGLLTANELSRLLDEDLLRGRPMTLVLCDVARLKDINDSLGHDAGDALLRTVAGRLSEYVPPGSLLARTGGGEFAVAIVDTTPASAALEMPRLAGRLCGLVQVLGVTVDLRMRLGWACSPVHGRSSGDLLRRADLALGAAKRGLRRSAGYSVDLEVDGLRRLRLVNDLRAAIDRREIDVVYQPLVTPADGQVVGAEALARWRHREFGPLPPDEFIVVAEQSGLIGPLTELVLDKALAQTRTWQEEGRLLRVAVNLSPRCLTDLGLPGMVLDVLARHRIEPGRLTLEITESSVAEDPARAEAVLERLRGLGVRLSIDDFGTGYSTLASLKRFPVQEVKLDRQFLADLEGRAEGDDEPGGVDIALLTAVVALGHSLGLEIVAEGVETATVFGQLRDLGVDVLQGYYVGRPGPGHDLPRDCFGAMPATNGEDPRPLAGRGSSAGKKVPLGAQGAVARSR